MAPATHIESAWPRYPGYRVDLLPCGLRAQAWAGDVLLASSERTLRVEETDHKHVLYFPLDDIRLDLMRPTEHHTICPFKGEASYWSGPGPDGENVLWSYPDPFPEVAGLAGFGAFYDDRVRVELVEGDTTFRFPTWGDVDHLVDLLDVRLDGPDRFVSVTRPDLRRQVVEGSQLLAQAIVAASKWAPDQRVTSASMVFSRAASPNAPMMFAVEPVAQGRTFSTLRVEASQDGRIRAPGLVLMDGGAPPVITHDEAPPSVPPPSECPPYDMGVTGRELRIVDGAYSPDPDAVGPPEIDAWLRYRAVPDVAYLHDALVAQFTGHLSIGAALRAHAGVGESQAHRSLSTAIMAINLSLHRPVVASDWMLWTHRSTSAAAGMTHAECRVHQGGALVASFTVDAMVRAMKASREEPTAL